MKFKGIYFWYGIPIFLVLVWIFLVFLPLSSTTKNKEKELLLIKNELASLDKDIAATNIYKTQRERHMDTLKEYITDIPVMERFPDYVKGIIKGSSKFGVTVINFSSAFTSIDKTSKSVLLTPAFDITVKGRFMDISNFLERLTGYRAYKTIKKAELSYNEKEYPVLTGRFLIEFKSWRRLPKLEGK
ncbi:MAG TPA: type 4a pilus biogenesis protein PilO [Syntrophorhabdaceae bacterium]|nr:type 4a pilus biogenesis protein PilO [Syntrophorhabdaceae bacterium]